MCICVIGQVPRDIFRGWKSSSFFHPVNEFSPFIHSFVTLNKISCVTNKMNRLTPLKPSTVIYPWSTMNGALFLYKLYLHHKPLCLFCSPKEANKWIASRSHQWSSLRWFILSSASMPREMMQQSKIMRDLLSPHWRHMYDNIVNYSQMYGLTTTPSFPSSIWTPSHSGRLELKCFRSTLDYGDTFWPNVDISIWLKSTGRDTKGSVCLWEMLDINNVQYLLWLYLHKMLYVKYTLCSWKL